MYAVVMRAGSCKYEMADFDTYKEAVNFCKELDWIFVDENDFEWNLEIED